MADFDRESMLEMFTFEMNQLLEQLEQNIIQGETGYSMDQINEIFRIMHTIKGSAAMMMFDSISLTAHSIEDLFYYLREENPQNLDYPRLTDHVLEGMDFIKVELGKVESGLATDGDGSAIIQKMKDFLQEIKKDKAAPAKSAAPSPQPKAQKATDVVSGAATGSHRFQAKVFFTEGCEMENIRAYTLVHNLGDMVTDVSHVPEDVIDEETIGTIRKNGFFLQFSSDKTYDEIYDVLSSTVYLKDLFLDQLSDGASSLSDSHSYQVVVTFENSEGMENVRAFAMVNNLEGRVDQMKYEPENLMDEASAEIIAKNGLKLDIATNQGKDELRQILSETLSVKDIMITDQNTIVEPAHVADEHMDLPVDNNGTVDAGEAGKNQPAAHIADNGGQQQAKKASPQHVINVSLSKLDQLLNLMGELVIAEAMVTQNPDLDGLELENFHKETRQLHKIINDVQDTVMSMRLVSLSTTFFKMHRIVRDMCRQLSKDVNLEIVGDDTEVDKNIIEHISDPLMHIIRNSVDHGIEMPEDRKAAGKSEKGTILLEAKNMGGDVLIIVRDDGAGLDKAAIMKKAKENGLLRKPENEYTDKEIHQFIFLPGFSTNAAVTEFSGRGVGMDVVNNNLEAVGGSVLVDSTPGEGSTFTMKIPATLAIIEGMTVKMGGSKYTIPIVSMKRSFKADQKKIFFDPDGNEMISESGEIYNVVRLYEFFGTTSSVTDIEDGIIIMLENGEQTICLFADELIGEQQVVVKTIPKYIKKIRGISGCTLLGNGDISLIIDVAGFFDR